MFNKYIFNDICRRRVGDPKHVRTQTLFCHSRVRQCIYSRQKLEGQESTREEDDQSVAQKEILRTYLRGGKDSVKSVCVQGICFISVVVRLGSTGCGGRNELLEVCGLGILIITTSIRTVFYNV